MIIDRIKRKYTICSSSDMGVGHIFITPLERMQGNRNAYLPYLEGINLYTRYYASQYTERSGSTFR